MEILWSGATQYHDWFKDDFKTVRGMVEELTAVGILGTAEWKTIGLHGAEKKVKQPDNWLNELLSSKQRTALLQVSAGGAHPAPWRITIMLQPFQNEANMVYGYNMMNVLFSNESLLNPAGSDVLYSTFKKVHTVENTSFAMIHPSKEWDELENRLTGAYRHPLTFSPMFSGVSWASLLGLNQLDYFDISKVRGIQMYQMDWVDDKGLYIRTSQSIASVIGGSFNTELIKLTETFRGALLKKDAIT
jgi:hypothetical protein